MINELVKLEKKYFKYFYKSGYDFRELLVAKILNDYFKNKKMLKKKIENNINFNFFYNSKISRDFLLNPSNNIKYIWEPQTTKLLLNISKNKKNVFFGGAFFGDQAVLCAKLNPKTTFHAFEPSSNQLKCLQLNKKINNVNNLKIINKVLYSKSNLKFNLESSNLPGKKSDEGEIKIILDKLKNNNSKKSISIDDYCKINKINFIDLIHIDVEGSENEIIKGSLKMLKANKIENIIFEMNSNYVSWKKGLQGTKIVKLLKKYKFKIYAIRDLHSSFNIKDVKIELLPMKNVFLKGPKHGFNMIATKNKTLERYIIKETCSPKYLFYKKENNFHTKGLKDAYKN